MVARGWLKRWHVAFALTAIVVLAGIVAVRLWFPNDRATQVSTDDVVARYRSDATATTSATSTTAATNAAEGGPTTTVYQHAITETDEALRPLTRPLRLPEAGVYRYATVGSESIDALNGATHDYPAETTITVTAEGCGVRLRWDALEQRSDDWVWCLDGDRIIEPTAIERHEFFGRTDTEEFTCTPPPRVVAAERTVGQAGLGACVNEHEEFTSMFETMDVKPITIESGPVNTVCVRQTLATGASPNASGELDGHGEYASTEYFLNEHGLPVMVIATKVTKRPSPVGDVNYRESYTLTLRSLDPMR